MRYFTRLGQKTRDITRVFLQCLEKQSSHKVVSMTIGTKYRPRCLLKDFDTSNTMDSSQDWHQHHDISQQNGANSREWASTLIFAYSTFWATRPDSHWTISIMSWYWRLKILIFSTIYFHIRLALWSFLSYSTWLALDYLILAVIRTRLIWYSFTP